MATFEDVTVPSLEDTLIEEQTRAEILDKYDKKIDWILTILLTDKEKYVYSKRITCRIPTRDLAKEMHTTKSNIDWIMIKAKRKMEAFRKFLGVL